MRQSILSNSCKLCSVNLTESFPNFSYMCADIQKNACSDAALIIFKTFIKFYRVFYWKVELNRINLHSILN